MKMSTRDLLCCVAVAACLSAWWAERRKANHAIYDRSRIESQRNEWKSRAGFAQAMLKEQGCQLVFYEHGLSFKTRDQLAQDPLPRPPREFGKKVDP